MIHSPLLVILVTAASCSEGSGSIHGAPGRQLQVLLLLLLLLCCFQLHLLVVLLGLDGLQQWHMGRTMSSNQGKQHVCCRAGLHEQM